MPLPSLEITDQPGEAFVKFNTGAEKPFLQFIHFVMRNQDSPLSIGQRELIAAFVSGINSCDLCFGSHAAVASHFGIDKDLITSLVKNFENTTVNDNFMPVLRYVRKLTLAPSKMTQNDIDAVLNGGWSERALYDAILICSAFNFMNRFSDGVGLGSFPELFDKTAGRLVGGYDSLISKLG
jgi:uncharacterized peroxidase-related enzyme